jgi:hypothetical protein
MKSDSEEIKLIIDNLAKEDWLNPVRSHWVKYLFHHTDIRNAVAILKSGKLLCRRRLDEIGGMVVDNASRPIISSTESQVKDFVRLYFRPRNPTQYRNEGVRPKDKHWKESHMPVPIFFLFDSKAILTRDDCLFSEGTLATSSGTSGLRSTAKDLSKFEFKKIYNDSPHNDKSINFHKNAEVVIPIELDLSAVKFIVCRSPAEKESLLNLLPTDIFVKWSSKILVDTKLNCFFRKWVYIQTVDLTSKYVAIDFSPDALEPGPFVLMAKLTGSREKVKEKQDFIANKKIVFNFVEEVFIYQIEIKLDDNLVYIGKFDGYDDIPF